MSFKRGDKVDFKGNRHFKPLAETYIYAVNNLHVAPYYILHPDGNKTKKCMRYRAGAVEFLGSFKYICAAAEEIEHTK